MHSTRESAFDIDHETFPHYQLLTYQDHSMLQASHISITQPVFPINTKIIPKYLLCRLLFSKSQQHLQPKAKAFLFPINTWKNIQDNQLNSKHLSFVGTAIQPESFHYGNYHISNNLLPIQHRFLRQFLKIHSFLDDLGKYQSQHHYKDQI